MYERIQKRTTAASPIQNHILRQNTGLPHAPKFLFNDIRISRPSAVPAQFKTMQQKTVACIQFKKEDVVKRILALLNLDTQNPDRNHALYSALTAAGIDKGKADELDRHDPEKFLLDNFDEAILTAAEQNLIGRDTNRTFQHVYGSLDKPDVSNCFSPGFNENHFASSFDDAFRISKSRFSQSVPASTVLYAFQKDTFWTKEYSSITSAAANSVFPTRHSYYFWHFTPADIASKELQDIPQESPLRKLSYATVNLTANARGKIYHLDGISGNTQEVPTEDKTEAVKKIKNACDRLKQISEKTGIPLLNEIYNYISVPRSALGNPDKSETRVIYALGKTILNFLNALLSSDYDTFYHGEEETPNGHTFPNTSYFDSVRSNLTDRNVQAYFSLRGCQTTYQAIIESLDNISTKYPDEEITDEEITDEES